MNDLQIQAQAYGYFLAEAPELLQTIEQEILTLPNEHTTAKVHNLMRALHTLKGAAANVGLGTIERIAHEFEEVARVLYNLEIEIDVSLQSLLLDGYSGLQECLDAQIMDREIDEQAIGDRIATTIEQLKLKLGDWELAEVALPTAMELGFDIVASIFETTIQEQIDALSAAIATQDSAQIENCLHLITDICIGLAESFELPGFLAINQAITAAITHHPDCLDAIAQLALANLQQAQAEVLSGDRTIGGTILPDLANLAQNQILEPFTPQLVEIDQNQFIPAPSPKLTDLNLNSVSNHPSPLTPHPSPLFRFQAFLTSDRFRTRNGLSADTQNLFNQIIHLCWDWFRHKIETPHSELNLELLVTTEGLADLDYIHHWIGLLLSDLSTSSDRSSLHLYRQSCIYQVVFAVAKYLADTGLHPQITPEFLAELRSHLQTTAIAYKEQSPVTINERGWIDRIIIPHHWAKIPTTITKEDSLLTEIWGQPDIFNQNSPNLTQSPNCEHQLVCVDRLQTLLIESHHRSIQHHQQLQDLNSQYHTTELAELVAGSIQLSQDLSIALETASELLAIVS